MRENHQLGRAEVAHPHWRVWPDLFYMVSQNHACNIEKLMKKGWVICNIVNTRVTYFRLLIVLLWHSCQPGTISESRQHCRDALFNITHMQSISGHRLQRLPVYFTVRSSSVLPCFAGARLYRGPFSSEAFRVEDPGPGKGSAAFVWGARFSVFIRETGQNRKLLFFVQQRCTQ